MSHPSTSPHPSRGQYRYLPGPTDNHKDRNSMDEILNTIQGAADWSLPAKVSLLGEVEPIKMARIRLKREQEVLNALSEIMCVCVCVCV